jgi:hypothetical protein
MGAELAHVIEHLISSVYDHMLFHAALADKAIAGVSTSQSRIVFEVIQFLLKLFLGQDLIKISVKVIH